MTTDMTCLADITCFDLQSDEETSFGIDTNDIYKYVGSFAKDAIIDIHVGDRVEMSHEKKLFVMPKLADIKTPKPFKNMDCDAVATFAPKVLLAVIKSAQAMSARITIFCKSPDEVAFTSEGDSNSKYSEALASLHPNPAFVPGEYKAMYPVEQLLAVVKALTAFDEITFAYSKDTPCFIFANSAEWKLRFIIAPIIER